MSRQVRYRVTALVLGGLFLGVPLLIDGTASAEQVEGGRQVVFGGGDMLGFSCRSEPEVESMTVPVGSAVRVVNRTGYSAELQLDGTVKGPIPDDGSTEVVFRRGTTAVLLSPNCAFGDESMPLLVTAAPAAVPDPVSASADSDSHSSDDAGDAVPDWVPPPVVKHLPVVKHPLAVQHLPVVKHPLAVQHPPVVRHPLTVKHPGVTGTADPPGRVRATTARPAAVGVAANAAQAMPQGGSASRNKTGLPRGTEAASSPLSGLPPGDHEATGPGLPALSFSPVTGTGPASPSVRASQVAQAEPVAMGSMSESGPIGLLALTAIVIVIGVAVAVIRAFVS